MKLNYFITLLVILSFTKINAQTKIITVVSFDDKKPLQNVLIYNNSTLIGETNYLGKSSISLNQIDSLSFVKNGYIDVTLAKNQLPDIVSLAKNEIIQLKEITITPITAKTLLRKIANFYESIDENGRKKSQPNYTLPHNLQIYNKFMAGTDTLHYLNNRFTFNKGVFKINNETKIVKNFKNVINKDNIYQTYYWNDKETNLYGLNSLSPLGIGYDGFSDFYHYQNLFDYKVIEDDLYYKLEFKQKKKTSLFSIEGYLIIDKFDYGIHEFTSKLLNDKPFFVRDTDFSNSNKAIVFKVLAENYQFKYVKQNDIYILDNCLKQTNFIEHKGKIKETLFSSTIQVEKTADFNNKNLKEFDMIKWEFKN